MNKLYINGQFVESISKNTLPVINPATEKVIDHIPDTSLDQVREAIAAAKAAQPAWHNLGSKEKAGLLHQVSGGLDNRAREIAKLLTEEGGKPYKENFDEVIWAMTAFDYYAEAARHDAGRIVGPTKENQIDLVIKEPFGVTAHILPYNYPIVLLAWQVAAALATGNCCIIKPSEFTSLCTMLMAEVFDILPPGTFNVVTGGPAVGQELVENRDVAFVAFTGSAHTGKKIMAMAAEQLKPTLIEAGGNNPFIVCEDAKIDVAVKGAAFSAFLNAGQVCTGTGRFYVHETVVDEFTTKLVDFTKSLRIGNGLEKVDIGPQTTEAQFKKLVRMVDEAVDEGAEVLCGGGRPEHLKTGYFYAPTVLTNVDHSMAIMQEEVFGPVAPIMAVKDIDEAIALAEDNDYGLGAVIYTNKLDYTMKAATSIKAGSVWVNDPLRDNDAAPFGGMKMSGVGRELGLEGLDTFRETKHVQIDFFQQEAPEWWFPYSDEEAYSE
jgi:betaine-aldehyde dehydrogenase